MKIAIVGAGAIGGYLGARLAAAGEDVTFIARNRNLAAINTHGFRLILEDGSTLHASKVRAVEQMADAGPQDAVLLTVKAHQVRDLLPGLRALFGPRTLLVTMINGVPWWYFQKLAGPYEGRAVTRVDPDGALAAGIECEHDGNWPVTPELVLKKIDAVLDPKVPVGFEMLISNFSLGITGLGMAMIGFKGIGPIVRNISDVLGNGIQSLVDNNLLPIASVIIEPAKVLFLNNAINHGVLGPLGVAEAKETGKSILFMLETNPGPGLGILLAFWFAGPRVVRGSVPGAVIIHFFGGIHEIYFPYILMKPRLILAAIAGGAAGVAMNVALSNGLTATPSPGSIFAYMVVTPKGDTFKVLLAIAVSAAVSFVVGWFLLKTDKSNNEDLASAKARKDSLKNG